MTIRCDILFLCDFSSFAFSFEKGQVNRVEYRSRFKDKTKIVDTRLLRKERAEYITKCGNKFEGKNNTRLRKTKKMRSASFFTRWRRLREKERGSWFKKTRQDPWFSGSANFSSAVAEFTGIPHIIIVPLECLQKGNCTRGGQALALPLFSMQHYPEHKIQIKLSSSLTSTTTASSLFLACSLFKYE